MVQEMRVNKMTMVKQQLPVCYMNYCDNTCLYFLISLCQPKRPSHTHTLIIMKYLLSANYIPENGVLYRKTKNII